MRSHSTAERKTGCAGPARRAGFTLIELLVVVAIIALLVAILVSALGGAKARGQQVACAANLHSLGTAWLTFAQTNGGVFPGINNTAGLAADGTDWQNDWMYGADTQYGDFSSNPPSTTNNFLPSWGFYAMPRYGTIYQYVNTPKVYLCPALSFIALNCKQGTNGNHDYTAPQLVSGAKLDLLPRSVNAYPVNRTTAFVSLTPVILPTPILLEEAPGANLNNGDSSKGGSYKNLDGAWCWADQLTANHMGGTNLTSIDGSTTLIQPPAMSTFIAEQVWFTLPSGKQQAINVDNKSAGNAWPFGAFNTQ